MGRADRRVFRLLAAFWILTVLGFVGWWMQSSNITSVAGFLMISLVLGYTLALPAYFLFFVARMRRPDPRLYLSRGYRVAFATTFVPGAESIETLKATVQAMVDQVGYRHDVWVLDEGNVAAVGELCDQIGALYFSRKGIPRYQGQAWPYKVRTKAGNYNAWLDMYGDDYDILLQMDTDHVPQPGYMLEMLKPFVDDDVAYVAAPSIANANRSESWVVRARCEIEATLHGPLQMGYNAGFAPLIIGSHAAFRVSALRSIGGFQHTLAEDHHNTLRLHAAGLRGVFSPDAIAYGDGAASFAEAMTQEYQWARALTQILLNFFPRDGRGLTPRLWFQFLFAEMWYPLFSISQGIGWLAPILVLVTGRPWVSVGYLPFLVIYGSSAIPCLLLVGWLRHRRWLRPVDVPVLSWRSILFTLARWPFILMAVAEAMFGAVLRRDFAFKVTAKGDLSGKTLPVRVLVPYVVVMVLPLVAVGIYLARGMSRSADGYMFLALASSVSYLVLIIVVVVLNQRENVQARRVSAPIARRMHFPGHVLALALVGMLTVTCSVALPRAVGGVTGSPSPTHRTVAPAPTASQGSSRPCATLGPTALEGARPSRGTCAVLPRGRQFLGVYDPGVAVTGAVDAEEVFLQWKPASGDEVRTQATRIFQLGRVPVIAIEPYPWDGNRTTLFPDIVAGRYDVVTRDIAQAVADFSPAPIYIRFAHEMNYTGVNPWAQGNPAAFIAADRHFASIMRTLAPNAQLIWSPGGDDDSARYYPGDDVVDQIGVTMLAATEWNYVHTFAELVASHSLPQFHKPTIICELGAAVPDQSAWVRQIRPVMAQHPEIMGAIYFDAKDPGVFNGPPANPDFRLSPADVTAFTGVPISGADRQQGAQ